MYYDFWVKLPEAPGKYVYEKRGETTYVKYTVYVYDKNHIEVRFLFHDLVEELAGKLE